MSVLTLLLLFIILKLVMNRISEEYEVCGNVSYPNVLLAAVTASIVITGDATMIFCLPVIVGLMYFDRFCRNNNIYGRVVKFFAQMMS